MGDRNFVTADECSNIFNMKLPSGQLSSVWLFPVSMRCPPTIHINRDSGIESARFVSSTGVDILIKKGFSPKDVKFIADARP